MLPRPAPGVTNAQRKGGLRTRSHNDDRTKGTVTGLPIPEAPRGSDGIENFEDLLEQGYDQNKQTEPRTIRQRTTNGLSKAAPPFTEQAIGDQFDRMLEQRDLSNTETHSRAVSDSSTIPSIAPSAARLLRATEVSYPQLTTPRPNQSRLAFTPNLGAGTFRPRSPAYDPTGSLSYAVPRASQGFGAISRYQDEQHEFDTVMDQYVDYNAGLENDDESPPPPEKESSPPQLTRKVVHSPVVSRTPRPGAKDVATPRKSPLPLSDHRSEDESHQVTSRHQALAREPATTGTENVGEKLSSPPSSLRKSKGKQRSVAPDDEDDLNMPNEAISSRKSNGLAIRGDEPEENGVHRSPSVSKGKPRSSQKSIGKGKAAELFENDDRPDEPEENGHVYDEEEDAVQHDDYDQGQADREPSPQDEPPLTGTERRSDQESEVEEPVPKAKKSKPKGPESQKKKRAREDDEEPVRQKKKPKSTSAKPPSQARSKTPIEDQSYFEQLEEPASEEEDTGARRSHRARIAPIKFWLGEKLEYDTWKPGRSTVVPTILGVRRVPESHESLQRKKRRSRQQSRSKSRRLQTEEPESDAEVVIYKDWDIDTEPKMNVIDYETGDMVEKLVAFTKSMVVPKMTAKGHFKYQRIFSDERFFAAGQLVIPKGGEKPKKSSKDNTYAFYVIEGAIRVMLNDTAFNLNPGGMFMVPRGNYYHIRSAGVTDAKLFFVQGRLMTQDDMETASYGEPVRAESALPSSRPGHSYGGEEMATSSRHGVSSSPQRRVNGGHRLSASPSKSRRR